MNFRRRFKLFLKLYHDCLKGKIRQKGCDTFGNSALEMDEIKGLSVSGRMSQCHARNGFNKYKYAGN